MQTFETGGAIIKKVIELGANALLQNSPIAMI